MQLKSFVLSFLHTVYYKSITVGRMRRKQNVAKDSVCAGTRLGLSACTFKRMFHLPIALVSAEFSGHFFKRYDLTFCVNQLVAEANI
jgi:hypothetical protein